MKYYKEDLAYIHDVGFSDYCLKSAPGILEIFQKNHINTGLVVDLGCGSGLWAQELVKSGYHVIGVELRSWIFDKNPTSEFYIYRKLTILPKICFFLSQ